MKGDKALEAGIEETWQRVARTAASAEPAEQDHWGARFFKVLDGFRFLPGGVVVQRKFTPMLARQLTARCRCKLSSSQCRCFKMPT